MTELRDARFKKALEAAPDSDARPTPSVANTLRTAAHNAIPAAVPRETPVSWWRRLWQSTGQPRSPWGAAFATVLMAVLVTVMWVREPIPDARPIAPPASKPAPLADAPLAEAPKPAPPVAAAPEKKSIATQPQTHSPATDAAAPVTAMAPAPAPMAEAPQARSETMPEQRAQIAKQSELNKALVAPQSSADVSGSEAWDALLVQTGERTVKLDRDQGRKLFALMQRLQPSLSTEQDDAQSGPAAAPDLLIKVQAQEQVIATFTVSGRLARWNRPDRVARIATLSDAQIAQLMQAVREASLSESPH